MRNDNVAVHTNRWVIKLEKESGEGGYFFAVGMEGEPLVSKHVNGLVQLFDSRDKAEKCTKWLRKVCGLNIEEATPEEYVHESTASLWLGQNEWPDGVSVEQSKEGRLNSLNRDRQQ